MPRVRPRFKATDMVVCWMPFSATVDGTPFAANTQTRLRADHPAVRAHPDHFALDGTPSDELARLRQAAMPLPQRDPDPLRVTIPERIPDSEAALATDSFYAGREFVPKGMRFRRTHQLVRAHPEMFRTPASPLENGAA